MKKPVTSKKSKKLASKLHKILSLIFTPILLFVAISGIGLNHADIIKNISVPIQSLPENYHFKQWNRGIIQVLVKDDEGGVYAAGKNGLGYFFNGSYQHIDNPLATNTWQSFIYSLYYDRSTNQLFVGSRDGLFRYQVSTKQWHYYAQTREQHIVSILRSDDLQSIIAIANYKIFTVNKNEIKPLAVQLKQSSKPTPFFRFVFALHSGELFGIAGILLMDLVALLLIYFCLSGLYYWLFPKLVRTKLLTRKQQIKGGRAFRWFAKYHNFLGLLFAPLFIISAITAAIMRPPGLLLITSAYSPVDIISSHARKNIPYKITKAALVENNFFLLTDNGVFSGNLTNSETMVCSQIDFSVPVHGMGATIFQQQHDGSILVGSFSGLFSWQKSTNGYKKIELLADTSDLLPVAAHQTNSGLVVFDYFKGKLFDQSNAFASMPNSINNSTKMALWSFFFELHNLRIFEHYIGAFYLLLLLALSISLFTIVVSGTVQYLRKKSGYKKMP